MVQAFTSPKLNTPEAAKHLGLRPGTLEIWRSLGKGPRYLKIGRRVQRSIFHTLQPSNFIGRNQRECRDARSSCLTSPYSPARPYLLNHTCLRLSTRTFCRGSSANMPLP